jgi:general secretion pathway protein I
MLRRLQTRGFTLLEVMIGLALLGVALTVLIRSAAGSIFASQDAQMMGVVTDLGRAKMYDIEEKLIKDGFTDTDQSEENRDFTEEGWPNVKYDYKVQEVELPGFDTLQAMAKGQAELKGSAAAAAGSGSGSAFGSAAGGLGSNALGGFQNSALGGMLSMVGGFGGSASDANSARGASLVSSQYGMFQQILKVSIRKVTLTMRWQVLNRPRDLQIVTYFTDQGAMDKVLNGMGAAELSDDSSGSGSGSGKKPTSSNDHRTTGSGSGK